jgi:hypothetical protein
VATKYLKDLGATLEYDPTTTTEAEAEADARQGHAEAMADLRARQAPAQLASARTSETRPIAVIPRAELPYPSRWAEPRTGSRLQPKAELSPAAQWARRNLLSGQLRALGAGVGAVGGALLGGAAGGIGALPGSVAGAGLGGAGGYSVEKFIRAAAGYDQPAKVWPHMRDTATVGLWDAATEGAGIGLGAGAGVGWRKLKDLAKNSKTTTSLIEAIPLYGRYHQTSREIAENKAREALEAGQQQYRRAEAMRKADFYADKEMQKQAIDVEKRGAKQAVEGLGRGGAGDAGIDLVEHANEVYKGLIKDIHDQVQPVMDVYGKAKVTAPQAYDVITQELQAMQVLGSKGIDKRRFGVLTGPRKQYAEELTRLYKRFAKTGAIELSELKGIVDDLDILGYDKAINSKIVGKFRKLRRDANDAFMDAVESVAGEARQGIQKARSAFSKRAGLLEHVKGIAQKQSEQVPERVIAQARSKLTETVLKNIDKLTPQLKKDVERVVLHDLAKTGLSPMHYTRILNKYGRETLKKILSKDAYRQVMELEKRYTNAFAARQGASAFLPSVLPESKEITVPSTQAANWLYKLAGKRAARSPLRVANKLQQAVQSGRMMVRQAQEDEK